MYQVYSTQRPGRPGWTLAASAGLLAATIGMAAGVVHLRHASSRVPLSDLSAFEDLGLRARVPLEWKAEPAVTDSHGAVLQFIEPAGRHEPGRRLLLLHYNSEPLSLTMEESISILGRVVRKVGTGVGMMQSEAMGTGPVGPYTGITMLLRPLLQMPGVQPYPASALGRVTVAPSGDVVGAVLLLTQEPRSADIRLLESICEALVLGDMAFVEHPESLMTAVGITFDPPAGVQFVDTRASEVPHLRLAGGRDDAAWFLEIYRVSVDGPRSLRQLVGQYTGSFLSPGQIESLGEDGRVAGRDVLRIPLAALTPVQMMGFIAAVRIDAGTALMVVGRFGPEGEEELDRVFTAIAGKAKVPDGDEPKPSRRGRKP